MALNRAFDAGTLSGLRKAVLAEAAAAGMPGDRAADVMLAVHELAANAVRHGAGHGRLRLWADGQALHCQVTDDGLAAQDHAKLDTAAWGREHGHGLWIIDKVADQVIMDRARFGTTVTVTFRFSSRRQLDE